MWIRFWYSVQGDSTDHWDWVSDRETDESLKEIAQEISSNALCYVADHWSYGFERATPGPEVVEELRKKWTAKLHNAQLMLKVLDEMI